MTEVRLLNLEVGMWKSEIRCHPTKNSEIRNPWPRPIWNACACTLVLIQHPDLLIDYQSSRARAGQNQ